MAYEIKKISDVVSEQRPAVYVLETHKVMKDIEGKEFTVVANRRNITKQELENRKAGLDAQVVEIVEQLATIATLEAEA